MKSYKTKNFLNTMSEYDWKIPSRRSTTIRMVLQHRYKDNIYMITKLKCQEEMEHVSESYVNDTNITVV